MSPIESTVLDDATAQELSERLADVFRTADVGDVLADDIFFDGHPPLWRFQLQGRDAFATWLKGYSPSGAHDSNGDWLRHGTRRAARGERRADDRPQDHPVRGTRRPRRRADRLLQRRLERSATGPSRCRSSAPPSLTMTTRDRHKRGRV
jgi:hypothetical protein